MTMGIYDRDYYRESSRGWFQNWGGHQGTVWLVALTVGAFIANLLSRGELMEWGDYYLPAILKGQIWRLVTPHFLHLGILHLVLNMFILYWVGSELEPIYGTIEFLAFYLGTAVLVSLGKVALGLAGLVGEDVHGIGASGPVTALFLLFACHHPYRRIYILFVIPAPAWVVAAGLVLLDLAGFLGAGEPGIGYTAHLLGAVFAFAYYRSGMRITHWVPRWPRGLSRRRPRLRVFEEPVRSEAAVGAPVLPSRSVVNRESDRPVDEQLEAKLDHVLEKVARSGRESLTPEEQAILQQASEIYKRRRGV
jgi:membrane associated rhomboid family serine protease